jgi:hypothetical protein
LGLGQFRGRGVGQAMARSEADPFRDRAPSAAV